MDLKYLHSLKEDALRKDILIPLFKKMGFNDVRHYHGGPREQGKDIVMWKSEIGRPRVDYAVVVKRGKITGSLTGTSNASQICHQIQQCFSDSYIDNALQSHKIHKVWVVTSGEENSKDALEAIKNILHPSNLDINVTFFAANDILEWYKEHNPVIDMKQSLSSIHNKMNSIDPYWGVDVIMKKDTTIYWICAKDKHGAKQNPLKVNFNIQIPDTDKGYKFRQEYESFIRKGTPLFINSDFIKDIELSKFLREVFGPISEGMHIIPVVKEHKMSIRLEILDLNSSVLSMSDKINLYVRRQGTDETFITNDNDEPIRIMLNINHSTGVITFQCRIETTGYSMIVISKYLRLQEYLETGNTLSVINTDNERLLYSFYLSNIGQHFAKQEYYMLIHKLAEIQRIFNKSIVIKEAKFSSHESLTINNIFSVINKGYYEAIIKEITVYFKRESLGSLIKDGMGTQYLFAHTIKGSYKIFGNNLDLGNGMIFFFIKITDEFFGLINRMLAADPAEYIDSGYEVNLLPVQELPVIKYFPDWLPEKKEWNLDSLSGHLFDLIKEKNKALEQASND